MWLLYFTVGSLHSVRSLTHGASARIEHPPMHWGTHAIGRLCSTSSSRTITAQVILSHGPHSLTIRSFISIKTCHRANCCVCRLKAQAHHSSSPPRSVYKRRWMTFSERSVFSSDTITASQYSTSASMTFSTVSDFIFRETSGRIGVNRRSPVFSRVRKIEINEFLIKIIHSHSDRPEIDGHSGVLITAGYLVVVSRQTWLHGGVLGMSHFFDTMTVTLPCAVTVSWGHSSASLLCASVSFTSSKLDMSF